MTVTTEPNDPGITRWAGLAEPTTVLTNVVLSMVAFVLAGRLGLQAAAEGANAGACLAGAIMAAGLAAAFGAAAHGLDPVTERYLRARFWRAALYVAGLISVATIASAAFFASRGVARTALLTFALIKLLVFVVRVTRKPEFRVVAIDYGAALGVLLLGACYALVRWQAPGTTWMIAGVLVSFVAGLVQAFRVSPNRWFNHNDLYHVIEIVALYLFYRGGVLLVDR
jgi:hypothetical protein